MRNFFVFTYTLLSMFRQSTLAQVQYYALQPSVPPADAKTLACIDDGQRLILSATNFSQGDFSDMIQFQIMNDTWFLLANNDNSILEVDTSPGFALCEQGCVYVNKDFTYHDISLLISWFKSIVIIQSTQS